MANYRKIYKDYYRMEFGKEFDIHHINKNKEDNDICNLILLPKKVHLSYHWKMNRAIEMLGIWGLEKFQFDIIDSNLHEEILFDMIETDRMVKPWVKFKEYLDHHMEYNIDGWEIIKIEMIDGKADIKFTPEPTIFGYTSSFRDDCTDDDLTLGIEDLKDTSSFLKNK